MKKQVKEIVYMTLLFLYFVQLIAQKAVVIVPVADLLGHPLTLTMRNVDKQYEKLPFSFVGNTTQQTYALCPRLHQLLYNDIVDVTSPDDTIVSPAHPGVSVATNHAIYYSNNKAQTHYWTLKKNIHLISDDDNSINNYIPQPIDYTDSLHSALRDEKIATLTHPHYDKKTQMTFSAGTRFVISPHHLQNNATIYVYAIDYHTMYVHTIPIPHKKCFLGTDELSPQQRIAAFLTLLKQWAHNDNGAIPYTWGGTSFIATVNEPFYKVITSTPEGECAYYEYEKYKNCQKTGFDCSGTVLRAAQICGIPYFCKNTTSITHDLQPLRHGETIEAGDLIVIPGHVIVASGDNCIIESGSYDYGYGTLHEIPLIEMFEGINTYDDLLNTYHQKKTVHRKDSTGQVKKKYDSFYIAKISSVWR